MSVDPWKGILKDTQRHSAYLRYFEEWEARIGSFLEYRLSQDDPSDSGRLPLGGVPFGVKDNIAVEGYHCTCGSKILKDFTSPYSATAVNRLKAAGAVPVGKCNLDEFGMGSSTDNSALKKTHNPWDVSRVAGGSSGGSAAAVAAGLVPFALGSDTGGSVRQPAAFCGVYGLKPTYGAVSRYGLVAYASSLEVVGVLADTVDTARRVFDVIKGQDELDQSSALYPGLSRDRGGNPGAAPPAASTARIAVVEGLEGLSPEVEETYRSSIDFYKAAGCEIQPVSLPSLDYAVAAYYTIATAEASANLARYTGIRYGYRDTGAVTMEEMVRSSRTKGFGDEVKLRILLGTYVLRSGFQDQYYGRAQKIRTAIRNDFDRVFAAADLLLMPVFPVQAFPHGDTSLDQFQQKLADKFTVAANLAGIPALSFPTAPRNGLPVGMQLLGPVFSEQRLFAAAEIHEKSLGGIPRPHGFRSV
ncbi:MAG: Asp-tRNA(Asn)/Glu-tRNA(Gln) amidotransferase subunit GatA [Spirochaetales bacterium]|nr:Asp-tRNA(Asn)/Glu-tRNA(Gln) amidotransferase subunit GatA [Spirochaetales bacterium]